MLLAQSDAAPCAQTTFTTTSVQRHTLRLGRSLRCRGYLGLAAVVDTAASAGLLPNTSVRWLCLRDLPPGTFIGSAAFRRGISLPSMAMASLRYGVPTISFRRSDLPGMQFARMLDGRRRWESNSRVDELGVDPVFQALVRINAMMSCRRLVEPVLLPMPYLAFSRHDVARLCSVLLESAPSSRPLIAFATSSHREREDSFCHGFCAAVAKGVRLRAVEAMTYLGFDDAVDDPHTRRHSFRLDRGGVVHLYLPADARIYVFPESDEPEPGDAHIDRGMCFGRATGTLPGEAWRGSSVSKQWATLPQVCGGLKQMRQLQRIWLMQQAIVQPDDPGILLLPAPLVLSACTKVRPISLWWDFRQCHPQVSDRSIYVFDPIPLRDWDELRLTIGNEIDVDAGIGDPRFIGRRPRHSPRRTPRILPTAA